MKFLKIVVISSLFVFVLSGCELLNWVTDDGEKKAFFIEIEEYSNFQKKATINKPWKVSWAKEILVSAQVLWRVSRIQSEEWEDVSGWQPVVQLKDDVAQYKLMLQRAKNALDGAVLNYENMEISLKKAVSDTNLALDQAEHNFESSQKVAEQTLKQAKQVLATSSLDDGGVARLSLDKMLIDIQNQIISLKSQFTVQKTQLLNLLDDSLKLSDSLLGVSNRYKSEVSSYEDCLWRRNDEIKNQAKHKIDDLYKKRDELTSFPVW